MASAARSLSLLAALLSDGCVSGGAELSQRELPCGVEVPNADPEAAVVYLQAPIANRFLTKCSGVAIGQSLVATQLKCVLGRSEPAGVVAPLDAGPPLPFESLLERSGSTNYATRCQQDAGWAPVETGDFFVRLGEPLEAGTISVSTTAIDPEALGIPAAKIFPMNANSLCTDGLALVSLREPLDLTPLPIRFGVTPSNGQAIRLSGFCRDDASAFSRHVIVSSVEAVTTDRPTKDAPARSLVAQQSVAANFSGGAAIDPETGAVVGVISSGGGSAGCGSQDPEGKTVVFLLAPYRRLLLEVAADVGETLHAELQPEIGIRPCPRP